MGVSGLTACAIREVYTWGAAAVGKGVCGVLDRGVSNCSFVYFSIWVIVVRTTCISASVFYYATAGTGF